MSKSQSDSKDYKYSTGADPDQTDMLERLTGEDEEEEPEVEVEIDMDDTEETENEEEEQPDKDDEQEDDAGTTYTPYRDDALYMTEDTSVTEVIEFLRRCIENPIEEDGIVIWNFSTHEMDQDALDALKRKEQDRFVIPYQVTGAWGFMFNLLPEEIKEAEILVYDPKKGHYMAYRSLYRTTADNRMDQITQDLSRRMVAESGDELGLIE